LGQPVIAGARYWASSGLWLAAWALLPLVFAYTWKRGAMPVISFLIVFSNGIWLLTLAYMDAFVWATIFHSLQYLAIVTIFHVKDRTQRPGARHGWAWHAAGFYAMCLPLGYLLFHAWPNAYLWAGYGFAESLLLTTAVINIHHFVVDAYIWRLRRANNQRIVAMAAVPASATPAA
jgi:hypothetical protein